MSLEKALRENRFDKRLLDHNLKTGEVTPEELKKHLDSLPDLAQQCEKINIEAQSDDESDIH